MIDLEIDFEIDFVIDHKIDSEIDFQIDYEIDSNATSGSSGQLPVTPIGGRKNVYGNIWHLSRLRSK